MTGTVSELFQNCDDWGAKEWFERMVDAIMPHPLDARFASNAASPTPSPTEPAAAHALEQIEAISDRCVNEEVYTTKNALDDLQSIRSIIKRAALTNPVPTTDGAVTDALERYRAQEPFGGDMVSNKQGTWVRFDDAMAKIAAAHPADGWRERKRPRLSELTAKAVAIVTDLEELASVEETEADGIDMPMSVIARYEFWRVKAGQALRALQELPAPLAVKPEGRQP